jgi:hypothetical protein
MNGSEVDVSKPQGVPASESPARFAESLQEIELALAYSASLP